jgi:hypothetical protein
MVSEKLTPVASDAPEFATFTSYVMVWPGSALPSPSGSVNESVLVAVTMVGAGSNAPASAEFALAALRAEAETRGVSGVTRITREIRRAVKTLVLLECWRG